MIAHTKGCFEVLEKFQQVFFCFSPICCYNSPWGLFLIDASYVPPYSVIVLCPSVPGVPVRPGTSLTTGTHPHWH